MIWISFEKIFFLTKGMVFFLFLAVAVAGPAAVTVHTRKNYEKIAQKN
jgi:hypothetical protein